MPLTVLRVDAATRYLVVEMGARGIGHIAYLCRIAPPDVAVVLNVGHAHVGEFGGREAIAQAKGELVEALGDDGVAVLNADDPRVRAMRTRTRARVLPFAVDETPDGPGRRLGRRTSSATTAGGTRSRCTPGRPGTSVRRRSRCAAPDATRSATPSPRPRPPWPSGWTSTSSPAR